MVEQIKRTAGQAFNIGSSEITSIGKLVNMILSKIDKDLSINYQEKDFPEISHQYLSSNKIMEWTDWRPNTKLSEGIDKSIKVYKDLFKEAHWND